MAPSPLPISSADRSRNFMAAVPRMGNVLQNPGLLDSKLRQTCEALAGVLDCELVWIGLFQERGNAIIGRGGVAPVSTNFLHSHRLVQAGSIEEQMAAKRRMQQIPDIQRDIRCREWWDLAQEWGIHGALAFPITNQREVLGVGLLAHTRWGLVLNPEEEDSLRFLGGLLGTAIVNDEGAARRQEQLTSPLLSMADRLRQAYDSETILQAVADELHERLNPTRTVIYWFADPREFEVRALAQTSSIFYVLPLGMRVAVKDISGLHQQLSQDRTTSIPDTLQDQRSYLSKSFINRLQLKALLAHPIIFQKKLLGYLCLEQCDQTRIWTDAEQRLIQGMANLIGVTASQAKLYEMQRRQYLEQILINRVVKDIRNSLDPNEVMGAAVDRLGPSLNVDRCLLLNFEANAPSLQVLHQFCKPGIPALSTHLPWPDAETDRQALTSAKPVAIEDITQDFRFMSWREVLQSGSTRSLMLCGLAHQGQTNGILCLHRCFVSQPWTDEERELFQAVSDQVGIALGQATLFKQTQEQVELETKLNRASRAIRAKEMSQIFGQLVREMTLAISAPRAIFAVRREQGWEVLAHHSRELSLTRPVLDLTPHEVLLDYLLQTDDIRVLSGPLEGFGSGNFSGLAGRFPANQELEGVLLILDVGGREWRNIEKQFIKQLMQEVLLAYAQGTAFTRLQNLSEQLQDLNTYRNNMVSIASHEMRTPLTSISLFVETMLVDRELVSTEDLEQMQIECNRMTNLLNNLSTLVNLEANTTQFTYREVLVSELLTRVKKRLTPIVEIHQAQIQYQDWTREALLKTDDQKLETVLYALLENACKHTRQGVQIQVEVTLVADKIIFTIADDGQGIAADKLPTLFQPFIRVEDVMNHSKGGAGLGLAISKEIVEKLGGVITVTSELGQGTTFTLQLALSGNSD